MQSKHAIALLSFVVLSLSAHSTFGAMDVPSGHYVLEKNHGYISFSYSHLGFSTPHIAFTDFEVDLQLDVEQPQNSKLNVTIDAKSVTSQVAEFDEHLAGERFFDSEKFPTITFVSTSIELGDAGTATITGDLTIKGQSPQVVLNAKLNKAGNHPMLKKPVAGFNAEAKVSRSAWGMGYAVPMVSDEVTLQISVELQFMP